LWLFDCVNCDKCVRVCPSDSDFVYETGVLRREYESYRYEKGTVKAVRGGMFEVKKQHQIANFQDFCNECGNCDTFCPEDGGPYIEKPNFFGTLKDWQRLTRRDGFHIESVGGIRRVYGRLQQREYRLEWSEGELRYSDGIF